VPLSPKSKCWFVLPILVALLATAGAWARPAAAQGSETPPGSSLQPPSDDETVPVIGRIKVMGNVATDSSRILHTFDVAPGIKFSQDMVRRGTRKLLALGLFSDVRVLRNEHDGAIDLTIVVQERPRLASVTVSGNQKKSTNDLDKKLFLRAGETYSATLVQTQLDSLQQYYRDEGFPRTKITPKLDTLTTKPNEVDLVFQIEEGEKYRITRIVFEGDSAFTVKRLRKAMKTKTKGFFGGGEIKDDTFAEDREKLEGWYHDHGFRDMHVVDFVTSPGATKQALTLTVKLDEGRRYRFGNVSWTGNKVVDSLTLARLWGRRRGGLYDRSRIEQAQTAAFGEYAEHGYLFYIGIEPHESVRDSFVDVEFTINEGVPSHVRMVSITGNKVTRENVIRRELDLHEGDLFRKSSLVRSQGDIMRLGLFEEANPDFSPADSSNVDLVFKLKEKQVGTASAGAGYTSQSGLTGFLDIGHNNVLGNGQQLALHLERGSLVENYSLSFTEPWFHDSPTLLGYSAYSQTNILTEFDERRRGISGRIGRPLPWPDYSRGSLSYTLENVKIDNVRDSLTLSGVPIGRWQLSSSIATNFVRNSADNPLYPTHGTRLTSTDDFTGGPLFGQVNYHQHRYEGRAWFPSPIKHFTTMVRYRIGILGQYMWINEPVPDYARFRLGGGSTPDPVRGYMDYQIVPPKFISSVVTGRTVTAIDSLTTPGRYDTTFADTYTTRRYPGGNYMELFTLEQQFPIVNPVHGVLFFDAGNTWDLRADIKPFRLDCGAGFGIRMEIPILGNVGFDYGYGFNRDDGPHWQGHFLLGSQGF